jgi:hypothetical protein
MAATAPHPKERRAALSVHAAQLAEEAGLTRAALNHMLRVAGPRAQGGRCASRRVGFLGSRGGERVAVRR